MAYSGRAAWSLYADGILEISAPNSGLLPALAALLTFRSLPQDVFVPSHVERQFFLRSDGNRLTARIRPPRDREKFMMIEQVLTIEGIEAAAWTETTDFDKLTALHPTERIVLENSKTRSISPRAVDLICAARARAAGFDRGAAADREDHPAQRYRARDPRELSGDTPDHAPRG